LKLIILVSCIRERVIGNKHGDGNAGNKPAQASVTDGVNQPGLSARSLLKSESISASKCIGEKSKHVNDVSNPHQRIISSSLNTCTGVFFWAKTASIFTSLFDVNISFLI
jgi:hypothetical protein